MNILRIVLISIFSTFLMVSCNNNSSKESSDTEITIEDITKLESELFSANMTTPDVEKALDLADMYVSYADLHIDDSLGPIYLFKAADIQMNIGNPKTTIALFNNIINMYPDYENIHTAMFLKGFVYEDQLNDYTNARKCYEEFLEKFPESDFADDAVVSLNNLGKSPEELIKEFEMKNNNNK